MSRKILCILSEWGFWGEELVGPLDAFDKQGYEVVFATSKGRRPLPLPASEDPSFIDPPLGRGVTSEENARKTRELSESSRLDKPLNLSAWLPEQPYRSSANYLREMEAYNNRLDEIRERDRARVRCDLIVGGSGPILNMVNNYRVHELILMFYQPQPTSCCGMLRCRMPRIRA